MTATVAWSSPLTATVGWFSPLTAGPTATPGTEEAVVHPLSAVVHPLSAMAPSRSAESAAAVTASGRWGCTRSA
jgi:hypothetical protein